MLHAAGVRQWENRIHAEGRAEGRAEEKRNGAARMLAMGKLSLEEIAAYADLSLDEVRALAEAERGKAD